ncbi:unnamed protein product [Urochloa decumbens]|uniref:DUF4378 domain-containing protein n=1 Tax=Urochloa decumbens TaxID=240449 RepID=A0ABC8XVQ9_9POAL
MAQEGAGGAPTPLRLKDLLELDCDSCSAAGFRCYPRRLGESPSAAPAAAMRRLLESPSSLSSSLRRHPSKLSSLSRSLSRRLLSRGSGFWLRRRGENDEVVAAAAPSGSELESRACSSETTSTSDDNSSTGRRGSRCGSDSDLSTASSSSTSDSMDAAVAGSATAGNELEGMKRGSGSSSVSEADDKEEQLSPVAVMDFPSDDDDDCACSPSFSLARLQRRKTLRPQHKIRRFGSTEELGPVDLESLLAATSDADDDPGDDVPAQQVIQCRTEEAAAVAPRCHEPDEHGLLALLLHAAGADHVSQRLLLDFFVEMTRRQRGSMERSEVLAAAKGWLDGAGSGRWGLNDVLRGGEAVVAEMERGRRWMQVGEEEREIGAVVAGVLADQLVDEVVWDLLV